MRASNLDGVVERALRLLVGFVQQIPGNLLFEDCTKNNRILVKENTNMSKQDND